MPKEIFLRLFIIFSSAIKLNTELQVFSYLDLVKLFDSDYAATLAMVFISLCVCFYQIFKLLIIKPILSVKNRVSLFIEKRKEKRKEEIRAAYVDYISEKIIKDVYDSIIEKYVNDDAHYKLITNKIKKLESDLSFMQKLVAISIYYSKTNENAPPLKYFLEEINDTINLCRPCQKHIFGIFKNPIIHNLDCDENSCSCPSLSSTESSSDSDY